MRTRNIALLLIGVALVPLPWIFNESYTGFRSTPNSDTYWEIKADGSGSVTHELMDAASFSGFLISIYASVRLSRDYIRERRKKLA
jgi:hypothetical protein